MQIFAAFEIAQTPHFVVTYYCSVQQVICCSVNMSHYYLVGSQNHVPEKEGSCAKLVDHAVIRYTIRICCLWLGLTKLHAKERLRACVVLRPRFHHGKNMIFHFFILNALGSMSFSQLQSINQGRSQMQALYILSTCLLFCFVEVQF